MNKKISIPQQSVTSTEKNGLSSGGKGHSPKVERSEKASEKKPPPSPEVKWFKRFGLPFLLFFEHDQVFNAAKKIYNNPNPEGPKNAFPLKVHSVFSRISEIDYLYETRNIAWIILCMATGVPISDSINLTFDPSAFAYTAKKRMEPYVIWTPEIKKIGFKLKQPPQKAKFTYKYFLAVVRVVLLTNLIGALSHEAGERSVGVFYLGICKDCGTPFYKEKKHKEYCSNNCAARVGAKRNYREREADFEQSRKAARKILNESI
ncbi:MAG: hypothetical protein WA705_08670 [Candidatus Ozemobacteraceae bacterium]